MRRKIGVVLGILGVLALVFGVVWMTVIWPGLAKIPANLGQQVDLQGTMTLFSEEHGAMTYDVSGHRKYTAQSATDDVVYLREDIWFEIAGTDQEIMRQQFLLGIDRVTRQNLEGLGDGVGGGHYNFPFDVKKDKVYPFWNEGNPANIDCVFIEETDYQGVHVYVFEMTTPEGGLALPGSFDTPTMTVEQTIKLYVEPVTGMPVQIEDKTKRTGLIPVPDPDFPSTKPMTYQEVTFYEDDLTFTEDTVAGLIDDANAARTQVALGKKLVPWLSIGSGILLVLVGVFLAIKPGKAAAAPPKPQAAAPQPEQK